MNLKVLLVAAMLPMTFAGCRGWQAANPKAHWESGKAVTVDGLLAKAASKSLTRMATAVISFFI